MRIFALLLVLLLSSCQGHKTMTIQEGTTTITVAQQGHLGGKDFTHVTRSAKGALAVTSRSDMSESFRDGAQAASLVAGGMISAGVSKARDAADASVALGAQRSGVAAQRIQSAERVALGSQAVETTRILNPAP